MIFRFAYRRYRLPLRAPVRTAHGVMREREGVLVRLETEAGTAGYGEAAPLPWLRAESVEEMDAVCRRIGARVDERRLAEVPPELASLRHAIASAAQAVSADTTPSTLAAEPAPAYLPVAALLPAGRAALPMILDKAESGFRVFKWKVGVADVAEELALLDDVCSRLPDKAKLRLDANGAWDRRAAERWLERCAERPVEFLEQPCLARATDTAAERRRVNDVLRGLAEDYPTPLALDESLVGDGDVEAWLGQGWRGFFVLKPSLLADAAATARKLEAAKARVVFSSALETAVGARDALRLAFDWTGETRALGFGVWPLFADARFDGPAAAPFLRREDVDRIDPGAVWNALN